MLNWTPRMRMSHAVLWYAGRLPRLLHCFDGNKLMLDIDEAGLERSLFPKAIQILKRKDAYSEKNINCSLALFSSLGSSARRLRKRWHAAAERLDSASRTFSSHTGGNGDHADDE